MVCALLMRFVCVEFLILVVEEDFEAPVSVRRELVFLHADDASDFRKFVFVAVKGCYVDGRDLYGEILISEFRRWVLVRRFSVVHVVVFPCRAKGSVVGEK